jgi:hypothetical protein
MFNVYVHLDVLGLSNDILERDEFLEALWRELPDAGLGGRGDVVTITLSQFALDSRTAARRQISRVRRALAALGWPAATVRLDETVREGLRDDVRWVIGAISWRLTH